MNVQYGQSWYLSVGQNSLQQQVKLGAIKFYLSIYDFEHVFDDQMLFCNIVDEITPNVVQLGNWFHSQELPGMVLPRLPCGTSEAD